MGGAPAPASGMDWTKVGPMSRKPTAAQEAKLKKEVEAFFKAEDALLLARDFDGLANRADYPVLMITDSATGAVEAESTTREQYVQTMRSFWEMVPPGTRTTHKLTIAVLSDSLASVADDYTTVMGPQVVRGRAASLLARVGGQWKYKVMTEAGWGGPKPSMPVGAPPPATPAPRPAPPPQAATTATPAPRATPAPAPSAAPAPTPAPRAAPAPAPKAPPPAPAPR